MKGGFLNIPGLNGSLLRKDGYRVVFSSVAALGLLASIYYLLQILDPSSLIRQELMILIIMSWLILTIFATILSRVPSSNLIHQLLLAYGFVVLSLQSILLPSISPILPVLWIAFLVLAFIIADTKFYKIYALLYLAHLLPKVIIETDGWTALICSTTGLVVISISFFIANALSHQVLPTMRISDLQQREQEEKARTITLINNITDAVLSVDSKGMVHLYNSAALDILDTNKDIDGQNIADLLKITDTDSKPIDIIKELSSSSSIRKRDDITMLTADEDQLRLEATFAPVLSGDSDNRKPSSYVLILRDITRLKSLEEERDEFISVVSHELRTPVTIAEASLSTSKILSDRGHHRKVNESLKEAHKQVIYLAKMVNDLSTLSRAERGISDEPESINVTDLIKQLETEYTKKAADKKIELRSDAPNQDVFVRTSRLYLQELLQNFITNAIRYTQKGSVSIIAKLDADKVTLSVSDTGIGISRADQKNIFKRFYRAEDYRTRETSGTGLGLYIATKLAKKMGTKIDIDSRLNHGTTISFSLPIEK